MPIPFGRGTSSPPKEVTIRQGPSQERTIEQGPVDRSEQRGQSSTSGPRGVILPTPSRRTGHLPQSTRPGTPNVRETSQAAPTRTLDISALAGGDGFTLRAPESKLAIQPSTAVPSTSQNLPVAAGREGSRSGGESQYQSASASIAQTRPVDSGGQHRPSNASVPRVPSLNRVASNLTSVLQTFPSLKAVSPRLDEPRSRSRSSQQAAAGPSSGPISVPIAAAGSPTRPPRGPTLPAQSSRNPSPITASVPPPSTRSLNKTRQGAEPCTKRLDAAAGSSKSSSNPSFRTINVGIEAEMYLAERQKRSDDTEQHDRCGAVDSFVRRLATIHNRYVRLPHAQMQQERREYEYTGEYTKWTIVEDTTIIRAWPPCKPLRF